MSSLCTRQIVPLTFRLASFHREHLIGVHLLERQYYKECADLPRQRFDDLPASGRRLIARRFCSPSSGAASLPGRAGATHNGAGQACARQMR